MLKDTGLRTELLQDLAKIKTHLLQAGVPKRSWQGIRVNNLGGVDYFLEDLHFHINGIMARVRKGKGIGQALYFVGLVHGMTIVDNEHH